MTRSGVIFVIIAIIAIGVGYVIYTQPEWLTPTSDAQPAAIEPPKIVHPRATGRIEPASGVVEVTATPGDRVVWLEERLKPSIQDRQSDEVATPVNVKQGDLLAKLESYEMKTLEIEALETQISEAKNRLDAERSAALAKVEAAKAELTVAEATVEDIDLQQEKIGLAKGNLELAQLALDNLNELKEADETLVNESQLKKQTLLVEQAAAQMKAEESLLAKAKTTSKNAIESATAALNAAKAGLRVVEAGSTVDTLNKQMELLQRQRNLGEIRAPRDGVVLKTYVQEGEAIGRMPFCLLANVDAIVVVAEVNETEVQYIDLAAPVKITSPAFSDAEVTGRIQSRDWIVAQADLSGPGAFAARDRRVIEYRILVDEADVPLVRDFIQLEVDVAFNQSVAEDGDEK